MVICLDRGADLHIAQLMPLPLTVSCFSKMQTGFTFLVPAHPGSPGQRVVKWMCVCVCGSMRQIKLTYVAFERMLKQHFVSNHLLTVTVRSVLYVIMTKTWCRIYHSSSILLKVCLYVHFVECFEICQSTLIVHSVQQQRKCAISYIKQDNKFIF